MPPRRRRVGKAFSPGLRLVEILDLRYRPAWNGAEKSANENRAVRQAEDRACSTRYDAPFCRRDFSCGPADLNAGRIAALLWDQHSLRARRCLAFGPADNQLAAATGRNNAKN